MAEQQQSSMGAGPPVDADVENRIRADERARIADTLGAVDRGVDAPVEPRIDDPSLVDDERRPGRRSIDPVDTHSAVVEQNSRDAATVRPDGTVEVVRTRSFSTGQLMSLVAGALIGALGVIVLAKIGVDTPLNQPVKSVFGWDHTPLLGLFEVAAGAMLVIFSLRPGGRWVVGLVGLALVAGGASILTESDWAVEELRAEQDFGWVVVVLGGVAVVAALITPRRHERISGTPVVPADHD